ncbi:unnamed protein product, partial [Symbiodinium sp. CCMP2456]
MPARAMEQVHRPQVLQGHMARDVVKHTKVMEAMQVPDMVHQTKPMATPTAPAMVGPGMVVDKVVRVVVATATVRRDMGKAQVMATMLVVIAACKTRLPHNSCPRNKCTTRTCPDLLYVVVACTAGHPATMRTLDILQELEGDRWQWAGSHVHGAVCAA